MPAPDLEAQKLTTADRLRVSATCGTAVILTARYARSIARELDSQDELLGIAERAVEQVKILAVLLPVLFASGLAIGVSIALILYGAFS